MTRNGHLSQRWSNFLKFQIFPLIHEIMREIVDHKDCFKNRQVRLDATGAITSMLELNPDTFIDLDAAMPYVRVGESGGGANDPSYPVVRRTDFLDRRFLDNRERVWPILLEHECRLGG